MYTFRQNVPPTLERSWPQSMFALDNFLCRLFWDKYLKNQIQQNLFIADMLYSKTLYSGHYSQERMESQSQSHRKTSLQQTEIADTSLYRTPFCGTNGIIVFLWLTSTIIKICYKVAMFCTNENIEKKDLHDNQGKKDYDWPFKS